MTEFLSANKDLLDVIAQLLLIIIPVVVAWFVRTYVKGTAAEKQIGSIVRLAKSAIHYVENMDKQGNLLLPPDVKKGTYKLNLAADWLESELHRNGIQVTDEQAAQWISSEFQKRVGEVKPTAAITELSRLAVDLVQNLLKGRSEETEIEPEQINYLAGLAADWLVAQMWQQQGVTISHDEAVTWVRAELLQRLQVKRLTSGDQLMDLARQMVSWVDDLKASGRLALRSSGRGIDVESDLAIARMLTEAASLGMSATPEEIAEAINTVLRQRNSNRV